MTTADSRVVAHRFRIRTSNDGKGCWVHDEGPGRHGDKIVNGMEYQDLTPLSLLAEAEGRIAALQSRLDAVAGLADEWKRRVMYDDPDQGSQEANDAYDDGLTTCANELRAALGCATTGEMK